MSDFKRRLVTGLGVLLALTIGGAILLASVAAWTVFIRWAAAC